MMDGLFMHLTEWCCFSKWKAACVTINILHWIIGFCHDACILANSCGGKLFYSSDISDKRAISKYFPWEMCSGGLQVIASPLKSNLWLTVSKTKPLLNKDWNMNMFVFSRSLFYMSILYAKHQDGWLLYLCSGLPD